MGQVVYLSGLILAICYILFSIDDLIWDIMYLFSKKAKNRHEHIEIEKLDSVPTKLLAIMVAAWHEDGVIEPVIENIIESAQYPRSMYHIFIGVYPNDSATIAAVTRLEQKYSNVHTVINVRPGPTCKADNINNIIRYIRQFEEVYNWHFASVTVHDSEDVVHPYEFKVTNYLIDNYDSLQFPVFPLQRMPTFKRFFSSLTSGTYADEFAENHFRTMVMRDNMSGIVPSAGTGFVISHGILDKYINKPLFPEDSLTEDYKLSLQFAEQGFRVHYVLEKVQRLTDDGILKDDYIATKSIFPSTFKTAVKQKTRWIYGITMQSAMFIDIFKPSKIGAAGRYTLYKDLKAKVGNLLILPGYVLFLYCVVAMVVKLPKMYPVYTLSWWMCIALTAMMAFRQTVRAVAIQHIYGFKSVVMACLLPPMMPIRLIWGNIINMVATIKSWRQLLFGVKKSKDNKKKVAWAKTDHEFLDKRVLNTFHRHIGDVLLEKGYIDQCDLKFYLEQSHQRNRKLGDLLLSYGIVSEEQLMQAIACSQNTLFIKNLTWFTNSMVSEFDKDKLEQFLVYPLFKVRSTYIFAKTDYTPNNAFEELGITDVIAVYTTKDNIVEALNITHATGFLKAYALKQAIERGSITYEQAIIAIDNQNYIKNIDKYMGIISNVQTAKPGVQEIHSESVIA